jgi:small subunit ribosomal protein S8
MLSDPISDMLTRIRNAGNAKHPSCKIPGSKIKNSILKILKAEGFIEDFQELKKENILEYQVLLRYDEEKKSVIREIDRVSKPGRRVYIQSENVRPYKSNMGISILSTSKGIMTNKKAIKLKVGGEVLCCVS